MLLFLLLLIALSATSNAFVCEGEGFFPDPTDCAKFYRCVTGTKYSFDCGPGTHFNPNCDCCDWPHSAGCEARGGGESGAEQPSRYQQPTGQQSGQGYGQQSGNSFRQYGQQSSAQGGQDQYQQYWPQSGQQSGQGLGQTGQQSGQVSGQYWQQSGQQQSVQTYPQSVQTYPQSGQNYGQQQVSQNGDYWQQQSGQSGQTADQYGQQPAQHQYGSQSRQPSGRKSQTAGNHRLPEESQQIPSRQPVPEDDDRSPNQRPNRVYGRRQQKTDRIGEEPLESGVVYEDPEPQRPQRPKPKPRPKSNRREENVLTEEDEQFDHKFDEPIEERRPKPKPRPRPQQTRRKQTTTTEEPDSDEEDDEEVEVITTSRPKVPRRKQRVRITTPAPTTEASDSNEDDSYNEFSQFENDVKTKDDDKFGDEDTNQWLQSEDIETTTTEDPFVSMLRERVPPQPRNKSRIDRHRNSGRRFQTTPQPIKTTESVTTVDPFDEEWADFIAGKNNEDQDQRTDSPSKSKADKKQKKKKPEKATDPHLMQDLISYFNCTEAGKSCDVCEELDWIKYSGTGLKTTPFRSYKFLPKVGSKQCYKACSETKQCIAFAYSLTTGMCHVYDQMTTEDIQPNKEFNTVIKNPKNGVMNEEWVHTKNGLISGKELYSVKADTVMDCLQECVNDMEYCMAVNYDQVEAKCRVFDANEGYAVNTVKANSISLQHLSIFEDNSQWRFDEIGHKTLANSRPIETINVKDSEECFYECMEKVGNNCSFVTIEDKKSDNNEEEEDVQKLCHLFPFNSSPKWIRSKDKSNTSFVMSVPKNHSRVQSFPGYTYVGNPIEVKEGLTEDECREYAEQNCPFCRKYTAVIETKECALFSDSALLSPALRDLNYTEKSGLISMPKDSEYMAFKRIPWKMFVTDVSPYEMKGEINGQKCLQFCLQQKLCVASALVYDTVEGAMFCYFFKESDLKNANITEYENVDLFVKIMDETEIPGHVSNNTDDCSSGEPLDSAVKNVNDLNANLDDVAPKKSSGDSGRYKSNSYPISPHGYDYYGGPDEESESQSYSERNSRKGNLRSVRSVNRNRRQESDDNEFESNARTKKNKKKREESDESEIPLTFIENVKQNARKEAVLERIPTITSEIRKKVKQNKLESLKITDEGGVQKKSTKPKTSREGRVDRLSQDCDNENEFGFDSNQCRDQTEAKDVTKMCTKVPKIIYSDQESMQSCNETVVGEDCPVICRPGYEPTEEKIKCEATRNRNFWKHSKQIKCKPIESLCERVDKRDGRDIRVKAVTKYPEEKLHFVTKYDTNRRLPQFSVYAHTKQNNQNKTIHSSDEEVEYLTNSCEELDDKQMKVSDYKESNYIPKPLLPEKAFHYSTGAESLVNTMSNIAPQDVFTNRGPWLTLENRTLEMLSSRPGIVISGICPQSLIESPPKNTRNKKKSEKALDIPQCFWSIYCVPFGEGVSAAVFYAENTHPISQLEKQSRVEQIKAVRDQRFIIKLLGTDIYKNLWIETYNAYKNLNKGIKSFIYKCAEADKITPEGNAFWDTVVNGGENVVEWQKKFNYGLEKNDWQSKKKNSSGDESQRQSSKRRTRDEQNISDERNLLQNSIEDLNELGNSKHGKQCKNKIIGYLTPFGDKVFTENEGKKLSHAILAHIDMDSDGNLGPFKEQSNESNLKFTKLYEMLTVKTRLLASGHSLKTMVSIGGWNDSEYFTSIVESPSKRNTLISDVLKVIEYWNLDGIEIDWKYPVKGGAKPGNSTDRDNFVLLLAEIRQSLDAYGRGKGLKDKLLLSISGSSGVWMIEDSYDLKNIEPIVDWINVLTYDYFGPWKSKWGANTGPNAPLYPSAPISSLSQMNIHSTLEKYYCLLNSSSKLVMSIPFYGHYWNNVGEPIDSTDPHFRDAHPVGGFVTYDNIKNKWLLNKEFQHLMHNKSFTPYLWSESQRVFLSYENKESIEEKISYAIDHKLDGVSIWALDFDDSENELLNTIVRSYKNCHKSSDEDSTYFKCGSAPISSSSQIKKWWSAEYGKNEGLCGRSAPLINGSYPICDPNSDSMRCCSSWGRCGSGPQFCNCKGCVDYKRNPELINKEPVRPTQTIRWITSDQLPEGEESEGIPVCGHKAIKLNGSHPICNPDDDNAHCCSAEGLCGSGADHCDCEHCVDFRKKPDFVFKEKLWWDSKDGHNRAHRCGKLAPKINDQYPICNPDSADAHCCGKWGSCGSGPLNCQCIGCVDYKKKPNFRWK